MIPPHPISPVPILQAEGVRRVYGQRTALDLRGQSLSIHQAEVLGLIGHNGSGKSTLMRMLAFLETPDSGRLFMDGELVWSRPKNVDSLPNILQLRRQVTLLLQTPYLLSRSVGDNVAYGLDARSIPDPQRSQRVHEALTAVGLSPEAFQHRRRNELSGGEAQRVALAARLAIRPRVLLMDEPTAGVDEASAERIAEAVTHARAHGTSVVAVSHDLDWLTPLCDRLIRFRAGKIV